VNYKKRKQLALDLFEGKKYKKLHQIIKDGKYFDYPSSPEGEKYCGHENVFLDEWFYYVNKCNIPEEILKEIFLELNEEELIYRAGRFWDIPDKMLLEAFLKLKEDEWVFEAGCSNWNIPRKVLQKAFLKLKKEEWICHAGQSWDIPGEMLINAFPKLKEDKWIHFACQCWNIPKTILEGKLV